MNHCNVKIDDMKVSFLCKPIMSKIDQEECDGFSGDEDGFCKYSMMFGCSNKKIQKVAAKKLLNSLVKLIHLIREDDNEVEHSCLGGMR